MLTLFGFLARRKGYEIALAALRDLPEGTVLLAGLVALFLTVRNQP